MARRTAVLIQNTKFADRSLSELPGNPPDLESLKSVLADPAGGGYQVQTLVDQKLQALRQALSRLFRGQEPEDQVLMIFFGQALLDQFGELYLAAADTDLDLVDATGLRLGYLRDQLDHSLSAAKIVVLDCPVTAVYSGGQDLLNTSAGVLEALAGNRQGRALLTASDQVEAVLTREGLAGTPGPKPFGSLLVTGLTSGAADLDADGVVTPTELHEYLYRETQARQPSALTPSKFTSPNTADLKLASNRSSQPTDLPDELKQALNSPMEWMREGAIGELERLLTGESRGMSRAAHDALSSLAADKTPQISRTATSILQQYEQSRAKGQPGAPQPRAGSGNLLTRLPLWARVTAGVVLLFAVGILAGISGLFGGTPAETPAATQPAAAPATSAPTQSAAPTSASEPTSAVEPTAEPAAVLPSSIGMVPITGGTYPIAVNQAGDVGNFWIDQFEVTNTEYAQFAQETGAPVPAYWTAENIPGQKGNHPVHGLEWDMAQAYCAWAHKRLPTEIEWEVAARGPLGLTYPWGNQPSAVSLPNSGTYPVGSIPTNRSYFGVYDMAGNVWEWVDQPYLPTTEDQRVLRGGAYNYPQTMSDRLPGDPTATATIADAGLRCAADEVQIQIDPGLLLTDEFSDVQSGWFQARAPVDEYFYGYHPSDFYHVQVSDPNDCLAVRHDLELDNLVADIEIFQAATATENGDYRYGLMLRESAGDFYAFLVSPRGKTWRTIKSNPEGIAVLAEGTDENIGGLTRDTEVHLVAVADGPQLTFYLNGELTSQIYDADYPSGNIGFIVQTLDETYAHIHFDRIFVHKLPANAVPITSVPAGAAIKANFTEPTCGGSVAGDDLLESFITYTVKEGDTLSGIANLFGLTVVEINGANGKRIQDPNVIKVGQILIIPEQ